MHYHCMFVNKRQRIRVITKLPNSEPSYKGKVKTHKYLNRQNQSTTGKLWKPLWPWLLKKWWVESDFKAPNLPLSLRLTGSGCHYNSIYNNNNREYHWDNREWTIQTNWQQWVHKTQAEDKQNKNKTPLYANKHK